jgi:hypothetical protein
MLSVIMIEGIILSVIKLIVVRVNVVFSDCRGSKFPLFSSLPLNHYVIRVP